MNIRNIRELKQTAAQRLDTARDAKRIVLIYAGINVVVSLLVTLVCWWLEGQISQQGGLRNMGTRTLLSTVNALLPMLANMALLCLELGFLAAMIRIGRGLYTSPQTLRAGMSRFWAMIRSALFLTWTYSLAVFGCLYLSAILFSITPLSRNAMEILSPMTASILDGTLVLDNAAAMALSESMLPMFALFALICAAVVIPMSYQFRLVSYILMDKPHYGALMAIRESKLLMRRNRFALFKLDLSFWWYYLLMMLSSVLCYGETVLILLGIGLPFSADVGYFLFFGLYLAALFAIYYFFRSRVGVTYALAYESLKPREEPENGVVLGNIFQT